jgi:hypothetical protein
VSKKPPEASARGKGRPKARTPQDSAFRRWLEGQLHQKYDPVLDEPIPEELLSVLKPESSGQPNDPRPKDDDRQE